MTTLSEFERAQDFPLEGGCIRCYSVAFLKGSEKRGRKVRSSLRSLLSIVE